MSEYHGHKTLIDGTHVSLTKDEAEQLWRSVEEEKAKRAETMPGATDALEMILSAQQRMNELGWWLGGGLKVRRGNKCAVAESGSTGIWSGYLDAEGEYVHYCDCVSEPRRVWLKPLADLTADERETLERCDRREREAFDAEIARYAAMEDQQP